MNKLDVNLGPRGLSVTFWSKDLGSLGRYLGFLSGRTTKRFRRWVYRRFPRIVKTRRFIDGGPEVVKALTLHSDPSFFPMGVKTKLPPTQ